MNPHCLGREAFSAPYTLPQQLRSLCSMTVSHVDLRTLLGPPPLALWVRGLTQIHNLMFIAASTEMLKKDFLPA